MEHHVQYDDEVFADAEPAVDVGLAVLVVSVVEKHEQGNEKNVDAEDDFLQLEGGQLVTVLGLEAAASVEVVGGAHVTEGRGQKRSEADLVNVELLLRGYDAETEEGQDFRHGQAKVEPDDQLGSGRQVSQPGMVNVVVQHGKQKPGRSVNGHASLPNVFLGNETAYRRRYRGGEVVHLAVSVRRILKIVPE